MIFLNLALLAGMGAAAVPLLIHLLSKSRPKVVAWAAMHLLLPAAQRSRRRIRLENWLLLLVRALIPVTLALALARPILTGAQAPTGDTPTAMVVLFDNSYSMQAGDAGATREQRARDAAAGILSHLPAGSEAAVVLMSGGVRTLGGAAQLDFSKLIQELSAVRCDASGVEMSRSLDAAAAILGKSTLAHRALVVVSDFQAGNWAQTDAPARAAAWTHLAALPIKPAITFVNVGASGGDNVALESITVSPSRIAPGQPVTIRTAVSNLGDTPHPDLRLYLRVDGQERAQSRLSLAAGERGQSLFTQTFDKPGPHLIEVSTDADRLVADNMAQYTLDVLDRLPVLLVSGEPSREPLRGETDFLALALQPTRGSGSVLQPRVVDAAGLTAQSLVGTRAVVLANVRQLTDAQVEMLQNFVRDGGGLLIFPGNRVQAPWYNDSLFNQGNGLLPTRLDRVVGSTRRTTHIAAQHFDYPALSLFNDPRNGDLGHGEVRQWFTLEAPPSSNAASARTVIARLDSGDAFAVAMKFGRGSVILAATACDTDWSDLPLDPSYVPLMRELVLSAAVAPDPPCNVATGSPLQAILPAGAIDSRVTIVDPDGVEHEVTTESRDGQGWAEYRDTAAPGVYTLRAASVTVPFVVTAAREESKIASLPPDQLAAVARDAGATTVTSAEEYASLDHTRRFGREVWRPVFWCVVALLFVEIVLQQWFTRKKPA